MEENEYPTISVTHNFPFKKWTDDDMIEFGVFVRTLKYMDGSKPQNQFTNPELLQLFIKNKENK